jgi:hypothetical protein
VHESPLFSSRVVTVCEPSVHEKEPEQLSTSELEALPEQPERSNTKPRARAAR